MALEQLLIAFPYGRGIVLHSLQRIGFDAASQLIAKAHISYGFGIAGLCRLGPPPESLLVVPGDMLAFVEPSADNVLRFGIAVGGASDDSPQAVRNLSD